MIMNKGDIVYYYEHWSKSIIKGRILKIYEVKDILVAKIESICFVSYDNQIIDNAYGVSNRPVLELFNSAKETYDFYYRKQKERIVYETNERFIECFCRCIGNHSLCRQQRRK